MLARLSQLHRNKAALIVCGGAVLLLAAAEFAWADPLDDITGLEELKHARVVDLEPEWEDWYQIRVKWRAALRDFQLQRARNARLAKGQRRLRRRNRAATRRSRIAPKQRKPKASQAARSSRPKKKASPGPDAFLAPTVQRQDARQQQKARKRRETPPSPPPEPDYGVEVQ